MQLMPDTARQLAKGRGLLSGDDMLVDPAANLTLGSAYLAALMKEFGEPRLAVAAYNAGPARVREWWKGRASDDVEAWGADGVKYTADGGVVTAGLAIYDTMQYVKNDVTTICIGQAASMAALLLAAGEPKKRLALPNSRILIHQPSMGGLSGQATDIDIHAREILRMREITNQLLAKHSGQKLDKVEKDVERDFIMNAQQAKEYGIIDDIIYKTAKAV